MTTVIIINYKSEQLTVDYVTKELSKLKGEFNTIVVNNAATSDSNNYLCKALEAEIVSLDNFKESKKRRYIVPSKENLGFAKGNNLATEIAAKHLKSRYLLFSNNDIVIKDTDIIDRLTEKLDADNRIGIIGPEVIGLKGERQSPEPYKPFLDRYCWMYLSTPFMSLKAKRKRFKLDYANNAQEGFHYKIMGAFFVVKTEDFIQCGMMDTNTFLYAEETILTERMKKIGKVPYYLPSVSVVHAHGQTTENTIGNKGINRYMIESEKYYYHEYMKTPKWKLFLGEIIYKLYHRIK